MLRVFSTRISIIISLMYAHIHAREITVINMGPRIIQIHPHIGMWPGQHREITLKNNQFTVNGVTHPVAPETQKVIIRNTADGLIIIDPKNNSL